MITRLPVTRVSAGQFFWTYVQLAGEWKGCDWSTDFGTTHLDLNGLRAVQTDPMCDATSGHEAADWRAAKQWLTQVEDDARRAELKAAKAAEFAEAGRLAEAIRLADEACAIEAKYHDRLVWHALHAAIKADQDLL